MSAARSAARYGDAQGVGECFPSELERNQPQSSSTALLCSQMSQPFLPCPARSWDRVTSHPQPWGHAAPGPGTGTNGRGLVPCPQDSAVKSSLCIYQFPWKPAGSPVRGQRCVVLQGLPAGKTSPGINILRKAEHLPPLVSETPSAAKG